MMCFIYMILFLKLSNFRYIVCNIFGLINKTLGSLMSFFIGMVLIIT